MVHVVRCVLPNVVPIPIGCSGVGIPQDACGAVRAPDVPFGLQGLQDACTGTGAADDYDMTWHLHHRHDSVSCTRRFFAPSDRTRFFRSHACFYSGKSLGGLLGRRSPNAYCRSFGAPVTKRSCRILGRKVKLYCEAGESSF